MLKRRSKNREIASCLRSWSRRSWKRALWRARLNAWVTLSALIPDMKPSGCGARPSNARTARLDRGTNRPIPVFVPGTFSKRRCRSQFRDRTMASSPRRIAVSTAAMTNACTTGVCLSADNSRSSSPGWSLLSRPSGELGLSDCGNSSWEGGLPNRDWRVAVSVGGFQARALLTAVQVFSAAGLDTQQALSMLLPRPIGVQDDK